MVDLRLKRRRRARRSRQAGAGGKLASHMVQDPPRSSHASSIKHSGLRSELRAPELCFFQTLLYLIPCMQINWCIFFLLVGFSSYLAKLETQIRTIIPFVVVFSGMFEYQICKINLTDEKLHKSIPIAANLRRDRMARSNSR